MVKNGNIKAEMARHGITQTELADMLGTNQTYISVMLNTELEKSEEEKILKVIDEKYGNMEA